MIDDYIIKGIRQGQPCNNELYSNSYNRIEKIYVSNPVKNGNEKPKNTDKDKRRKKKGSGFKMGRDSCEISEEGMHIYQTAMEAAKNLPDIREDKIAEIREAMENGTYDITPEMVAEKLLS